MKTEDWETVEALFHMAHDLKGEDRVTFLDTDCGSETALRRILERLLQHSDSTFLGTPAVELVSVTIPVGTVIGPYEIIEVAGVGGMGQVYRAHDSRLKRDVAIKVVQSKSPTDLRRTVQFERESTLLASINHPNIAAIYDVLEGNRYSCLVLEFVEGPTLR